MPERIQLRRTKGWRMPPHTWAVTRPGRWGNPYKAGTDYAWKAGEPCPYPRPWEGGDYPAGRVVRCADSAEAVTWYRLWITEMAPVTYRDAVTCLAGWNLACWCPLGAPCHGDVLLQISNGMPDTTETTA